MIGWKIIYLVVAAVIYIILISLFFNIEIASMKCSDSNSCVRFCESDQNVISDSELIQKFKNSAVYRSSYRNSFLKKFTIYREELKCKKIKTPDRLEAMLTSVIEILVIKI